MTYERISIAAIVAFLGFGCAQSPTENHGAADNRPRAANKIGIATTPPSQVAKSAAKALTVGRISLLSGKAAISSNAEPAKQGFVKFSWVDPSVVDGNLDLGDISFDLNGFKTDDTLSCWLTFMSDDPNQVRRGVLSGTRNGDGFEGTFVIASNGGAALINGTWSAKL